MQETSQTPATCPTCSTVVPEGAAKCVGCGQVFGEANRCPHCNAIAAVRPSSSGGHVCMACGKVRSAGPGVTVFRPKSAGVRAKSTGKRTLGIFALAAGVFGAIAVAAAIPTGLGLVLAGVVGAAGVGFGALAMRSGAGGGVSGGLENQIISLAEEKGGVLTVTDVARALNMTQVEADEILSGMADGSRVWAEVTTDGMMRYEFRELMSQRGPQVRVADELAERIEMSAEEHELAEAEREVEAMLSGRPDLD